MRKNKKGVTLITLIVILGALAIAAAIAIPSIFSAIDKARQREDAAAVDLVNTAIRMYAAQHTENGKLPTATVKDCLAKVGMEVPTLKSAASKLFWISGSGDKPGYYALNVTTGTPTDFTKADAQSINA